jgi:hypothetical protein
MRAYALLVFATPLFVIVACENSASSPQPTAPTASYANPPPGYAQPPPGQAQPPPGYPAPGYAPGYATAAPAYPPAAAQYPAPAPAPAYPPAPAPTVAPAPVPPGAPAPAAGGTMATPGLLALPCQSDATCGLHRCNTQYGKCAFPCQSAAADCAPASQCLMGVCVPGSGS